MNNETKHTPGPWYLADLGRGKIGIQKHEAEIISRIAVCHPEMLADEHGGSATANARLIAAAPDMLEALKLADQVLRLGSCREAYITDNPTRTIIETAIAKAEGQEKP